VPLSESVLISDIAIIGTARPDDDFPLRGQRRIGLQAPACYDKPAAAHHDYWIDLSSMLEEDEIVIGSYAWSSEPDDLTVTWVYYSMKGAWFFVSGGTNDLTYEATLSVKTSTGRVFQFVTEITVERNINEALAVYVPPDLLGPADPATLFLVDVRGVPIAPPLNAVDGGWTP
jgi:hypothetical protein